MLTESNISDIIDKINFKTYKITIKFKSDVKFLFFHGSKIYDLCCKSLKRGINKLGNDIILYPVESGRTEYSRGDCYNFGLTKINPEKYFLKYLESQLSNISEYIPKQNSLDGVFEVVEVTETEKDYIPSFQNDMDLKLYIIKFETPLRMSRGDKITGHKYFDMSYFNLNQFMNLAFHRIMKMANLFSILEFSKEIQFNINYAVTKINMMWIDMPYSSKTLGGVIGKVYLNAKLSSSEKQLLWFGQIIGVGNNISFGFGKYSIINNSNFYINRIAPYESFLSKVAKLNNLAEAYEVVRSSFQHQESENNEYKEFEKNLKQNLETLSTELLNGKYQPEPLKGFFLKHDNKIRALAIPKIRDKILQRAVVKILSDSIDTFLEESSYAYRKGHSRIGASKAIRKAYEQGFKYVVETDIESFFDTVKWDLLFDKIDIILNNDPLSSLIKIWVSQPVIYNNILINRTLGLPQGCPISPMLSNLYLDEFDELMQAEFKLVRYCDDFVILCRSKEEAEKALCKAKEYLKSLMLEINPAKTKITSFEEGFQYLGYLFTESEIIEIKKKRGVEKDLKSRTVHNNWLMNINLKRLKEIQIARPEVFSIKEHNYHPDLENKFPVYITGLDYKVYVSKSTLFIVSEYYKDDVIKIPLENILYITFFGQPKTTLNTILYIKDLNIASYFCTESGHMNLSILHEKNYNIWYQQMEFQKKIDAVLRISKSIVSAKINNQKILSGRQGWNENRNKYNELISKINTVSSLDSLRGIEGFASKYFFEDIEKCYGEKWDFKGRRRQPPPDPINSMLSFGYTILYNRISHSLFSGGINPEIGFYHSIKKEHNSLASDIVEEFRFIIEGLVFSMINRNQVSFKDYEFNKNNYYPCLLTKTFRKKFISKIEERFADSVEYEGKKQSYFEIFEKKSKHVKDIVNNKTDFYLTFKIK